MPRVKRGLTRHRRHNKVLGMVKGHQMSRGHLFRTAHQEMMHSLMYAYRDRRNRKRDMRGLWIVRINAAARQHGLPYNRFMAGMTRLGLEIDRKMLAEMAVNDPLGFATLAYRVRGEEMPADVRTRLVQSPGPDQTVLAASAEASAADAAAVGATSTTAAEESGTDTDQEGDAPEDDAEAAEAEDEGDAADEGAVEGYEGDEEEAAEEGENA